ncbi:HesA/MoeB/ThiF family protein [Sphingomonas echinoides]|uniref:Molybdopterin-synthase adenylyltransferase MoeB n=1 Tax=Sphingomonas echinoides TaxID=59803 RepID=A0ABU4PUQ0_9SPHN|nr:molybdopterin-synthase adenylyltransferase MoeB [Sphingomonas echinoides]MDX5985695.1 molybdopterin-synthase adenylyltransferase MoeB [Sphingomonas echinoides]
MTLSDEELNRYARHIVLREVGGAGQMRLKAATVAIVGAGGIGSPAIQYLAAAGIGRLIVIDDDTVDLSNLQRQTVFGDADVGAGKVAAAAHAAHRINPHVVLDQRPERLTPDTAAHLLGGADVVIDGTDSFATRLAVADAAHGLRIPLVSSAVGQFEGQLGVFRGWEADKPCYRCFVGNVVDQAGDSCAEQGVLGAMTGVMGSLAALEAMRSVVGFGEDSAGKLLLVDALAFRFRTIALPKDPGCPACG